MPQAHHPVQDVDDEENQDEPRPELLPQKPWVKHDREKRRKNTPMRNCSRKNSDRAGMTSKRISRKASRIALQKISKNCEDLSNLGKKLRRPSNYDKQRRIRFAVSQNEKISLDEIDRYMQDSPDIPYDPEKIPKSKILKTNSSFSPPNKYITQKSMVHYNTKMNGKSIAAKSLMNVCQTRTLRSAISL